MDLFQFALPEDTDLFKQAPDLQAPQAPTTSPAQAVKTARVAALALTDPNKPDLLGQMDANLSDIQDTIDKVGDMDFRRRAAAMDTLDKINSFTNLVRSREAQVDPTLAQGAMAAANQAVLADQEREAQYAMEKRAVERIQDLAAAGDTSQARMLLNNLQNGDSNKVIRDMSTKALILEREIEKAKDAKTGDWIGSAANFILSIVPLYSSTGQVGNVDIESGLKGWLDWAFSGKRVQAESNTLWNMPVEDFSDYVKNELIPRIKDKSTLLGFEDKSKELETISKLHKPSGVFTQNAWDALNNLGWIGPAELTKAASIPGLLVRNGARKEAGNLLAQAAIELRTYGAEEALKKTGVGAEELIDHMLPDAVNPTTQKYQVGGYFVHPEAKDDPFNIISVNPDGTLNLKDGFGDINNITPEKFFSLDDPGSYKYVAPQTEAASSVVSLQADINNVIEQTDKIMSQFQSLNQLGRLTSEEMQAAIDSTIAKITKEHGDDWVKDVAVKDIKLSDGTSFKRVEFTLGTFEYPEQALKYAQEMGFGDNINIEGFASNADRAIRVIHGVPTVKQPAFAKWFEKSKITSDYNPGGTPRKMYHGTKKQHDTFDPAKSNYYGGQMFFAENPKTTHSFNGTYNQKITDQGKTIPVYINSVNPFDPKENPEHKKQWIEFLTSNPEGKKLLDSHGYGGLHLDDPNSEVVNGYWGLMEKKPAVDWIKANGHDGFWIWSHSEGRNLVVWDPEQIVNAIEPSDLNSKIIRDESGQYSFRVSKDVLETGFHTEVLKPQATGFLSRVLLSARAVGDRLLANMGQSAGNTRAKLLKTFVKDYSKKFSVLSRREREDLAQVLAVGENNAEWYSRDQLDVMYQRAFKRPPSERELIAYDTARNLNDIEYMLRNDEVYKQKVVQGYESVTTASTGEVNGRVITDWQILPTDRVYNISDKIGYSKISPMLSDDMVRLKGEGYALVKLDNAVKLEDGTVTNAILARRSDLEIKPLRRDQINYRPGGHRIYEGKYFAKQARIGVQPDGEKFLMNPSTFIVGKTKAEVDYWTSQMERARQLYVSGASDDVIQEALPTNVSFAQFNAGMLDGTFDPDQVFRTAYDRETLPEYVNTKGYSDLRDLEETDIQQYLRTSGRMYYGHKGEILPDWQGSQAPTLDPFKTIERSLFNVANLSSFSDYKISASERWHNTFGGYLNQTGLTPMQAIREGTFGLNVPEAIRQAAEAQRDIIRRTLGWKTEFDRQQEIYTRRFAEWVAGDDPYSLRNKVVSSVSEWFDTNHPIQALRGLAFDLKLGLFNVAQFPLQIGTLAAAMTISPKYGMQGMINLFPMKAYLTKSGTEAMLDTLVQRGTHTSAGFASPEEYKEFMRFAKKSGFFDIGSTHQLINDYGPNAAIGAFKRLDTVREAARFWFYEGELWNRMVAWRIAWGETVEKLPNVAKDSPEFLGEVTGRAEEFAFSMSDQSAAAWQKGITSIPTQFWAYNARMLEAMLGKTFTPAQKVRLIVGQTMLYGAAGVPVAPFILERMNANRGEVAPINSLEGLVTRGLLDQAIYHMTKEDLLVSKRYGTGAFISDTIKDILGMSAYGEKSMAEILGGASYSIAYDGFETIFDLLKYMSAESGAQDTGLTEDAFLRLAKNISTVSNAHKAYMVHKYGTLVSNKGTTLAANVPSQTAWAVALGIQPGEVDQVTAAMQYLQDDKEAVDEAVKVISNYRTRMVNETDNREDIYQEINAYVQMLPPEVRLQALKKAQTRLQPSLLDGLRIQIEKDRVRAEALKNMEGNNGSDSNSQ